MNWAAIGVLNGPWFAVSDGMLMVVAPPSKATIVVTRSIMLSRSLAAKSTPEIAALTVSEALRKTGVDIIDGVRLHPSALQQRGFRLAGDQRTESSSVISMSTYQNENAESRGRSTRGRTSLHRYRDRARNVRSQAGIAAPCGSSKLWTRCASVLLSNPPTFEMFFPMVPEVSHTRPG